MSERAPLRVVATHDFCCAYPPSLTSYGGYDPHGFPWRSQLTAVVTLAVGGTAMGLAYLVGLRLFRVRELDGLLRPLLARLGR